MTNAQKAKAPLRRRAFQSLAIAIWLLLLASCDFLGVFPWQVRVPIQDVGAQFIIADATWFEDEQTLFIFYQIDANQGLSDNSQFELAFRTDEIDQEFVNLEALPPVHEHLVADCGETSLCGSYSTHVELVPRDVRIRLRYHRDGELTLNAQVASHVVNSGLPHESRSAVVYGVFNEENLNVQWRLRHQFPAIRNHHATALGLRRDFRIENVLYGTYAGARDLLVSNPYGYGLSTGCPPSFDEHETLLIRTSERAVFATLPLPIESSTAPHVCASSVVIDALGEFRIAALAQKNPQSRAAFPALQTPVTENTLVPFFLEVCGSPTSPLHRAMQMQRLFLEEEDVICIDDFATAGFPDRLANTISADVDEARIKGEDMVLVIALSRPQNSAIARRVEEALAIVVPPEHQQSSPRVSGAFVFDTDPYAMSNPEVSRLTLWCPSSFGGPDLDAIPDTSARSCAVQPTIPLEFGELSLSSLPILPTEDQFETFIAKYGPNQTGSMTEVSVRAPRRTPTTDNVPVGDFGIATFFNSEVITPAPTDAFSYCAEDDTGLIVFRIDGFPDVLPLAVLGEVHALLGLTRYELGLFWQFPFLLQMKYESTAAVAINLPEEIPFVLGAGISTPAEEFLGSPQWSLGIFEIGDALAQCTRFCDHPTFDSSSVYNVDDLFVSAYASRCYRPRFPSIGDNGFPPDP